MEKIIVVYGGFSNEKAVSEATGKAVIKALEETSYDVLGYCLTADILAFIHFLEKEKPDVVFNALHGAYGEDGHIQALLNLMNIPYTHSGLRASSVAMDKALTNQIYSYHGLPVAPHIVVKGSEVENLFPLKRDVVIKPVSDGSSVGVYIVKKGSLAPNDLQLGADTPMMVEDYIEGREFTISVFSDWVSSVTEIKTDHAFYDYASKYEPGGSQHILPADLSSDEEEKIKDYAQKAYDFLGCRGVARVDFCYDGKQFYILEINTQPGMTPTSLMPEQMAYEGISYSALCVRLIQEAMVDK